jgi:hypothetical protein
LSQTVLHVCQQVTPAVKTFDASQFMIELRFVSMVSSSASFDLTSSSCFKSNLVNVSGESQPPAALTLVHGKLPCQAAAL